MKITFQNNEAKFLVRIADTSLILAQRLAELCSKAPFLEEDIAISNCSLDLFGRAEELYKIIGEIEGNIHSPDDYVFRRNEREYFNIKLVEQPNEDFAWTVARQFMHDVWAKEVFTQLLEYKNEDAISELKIAIKLNPNDTRSMYNLATYYFQDKKNLILSESYIKRALKIETSNQDYKYLLALIYRDLGKTDSSQKIMRELNANQ